MAEDKGGWQERWQYRQEMKAHGAWSSWGLPTRADYAQFHDARNLADLVKTWRPLMAEAYGLGAQGLTPLTQAEKEEAYRLLDKRMESGLSDAEVQTYAQLVNRWEAEHHRLAGEDMRAPTPAEEASYQSWLRQHHTGEGQTQVVSPQEEPPAAPEQDVQRLKARMEELAGLRTGLSAVDIAERIADLLEEAQRQGLVVTDAKTPAETPALKQHKRMSY